MEIVTTEGEVSNEDITTVPNAKFDSLEIDLLVGGFPCQDYSVSRSLNNEVTGILELEEI